MVEFFVPPTETADSDDPETNYAALAATAGASVPPPEERIYSMTFLHDGIEWVATVGQKLRGTKWEVRTVKGQRRDVPQRLSGSESVVAIFAGAPYKVLIDTYPLSERRSQWANPIWATHNPRHLLYFDVEAAEISTSEKSE